MPSEEDAKRMRELMGALREFHLDTTSEEPLSDDELQQVEQASRKLAELESLVQKIDERAKCPWSENTRETIGVPWSVDGLMNQIKDNIVVDDNMPKNQIKVVNKETGEAVVFNVGDGKTPNKNGDVFPDDEEAIKEWAEKGAEFITWEAEFENPIAAVLGLESPKVSFKTSSGEEGHEPSQARMEREQFLFNQLHEEKKTKYCSQCRYWDQEIVDEGHHIQHGICQVDVKGTHPGKRTRSNYYCDCFELKETV